MDRSKNSQKFDVSCNLAKKRFSCQNSRRILEQKTQRTVAKCFLPQNFLEILDHKISEYSPRAPVPNFSEIFVGTKFPRNLTRDNKTNSFQNFLENLGRTVPKFPRKFRSRVISGDNKTNSCQNFLENLGRTVPKFPRKFRSRVISGSSVSRPKISGEFWGEKRSE